VLEVVDREAAAVGASLSVLGRDFSVLDNRVALGGRYLSLRTSAGDYEGMFLSLHGSHQATNAAVALEAVTRFVAEGSLEREVVQEGLGTTVVPGRLEAVAPEGGPGPPVIFDVAHNPDGISALVVGLTETFAFERVVFVVGVLGDKDYRGMLAELARLPCAVVLTEPVSVRAVALDRLRDVARELVLEHVEVADVGDALATALRMAGDHELVCVTGSHYVVGEARASLVSA
jgi:dihydrofolate synthase/folylpolyglutamate synthase